MPTKINRKLGDLGEFYEIQVVRLFQSEAYSIQDVYVRVRLNRALDWDEFQNLGPEGECCSIEQALAAAYDEARCNHDFDCCGCTSTSASAIERRAHNIFVVQLTSITNI